MSYPTKNNTKKLNMDILYMSPDIQCVVEIIKDRLYFAIVSTEKTIQNQGQTMFFRVDREYVYVNYYNDFGPLNISCLYKYCQKLNEYLRRNDYKRIVHYTPDHIHKKTNAAYLIGCYSVLYINMSPKDLYKAFLSSNANFKPFVDASQGISNWTINLLDCFNAILKANTLGFFNFKDFNANEYDKYDKLHNGDLNWLLPRKFLAFIGPTDQPLQNYHSPSFYIKYFLDNDVKTVIRLNNATYDPSVFYSAGIEHYDLFFPDGSTPPKQILIKFLHIVETTKGAIAVHCKAGLGRTGSLIGAYIMKHFRMTAKETIAWLRICRPGSVIGQQQGWLERIESWLWRQGSNFRLVHFGVCDKVPHFKYGIYSIAWKHEREKSKQENKEKQNEVLLKTSNLKCIPNKNFRKTPSKEQVYNLSKYFKTQGDKLNQIKFKQAIVPNPSFNHGIDKKKCSKIHLENPKKQICRQN